MLDVMMPQMDDIQACKEFREDGGDGNSPSTLLCFDGLLDFYMDIDNSATG